MLFITRLTRLPVPSLPLFLLLGARMLLRRRGRGTWGRARSRARPAWVAGAGRRLVSNVSTSVKPGLAAGRLFRTRRRRAAVLAVAGVSLAATLAFGCLLGGREGPATFVMRKRTAYGGVYERVRQPKSADPVI